VLVERDDLLQAARELEPLPTKVTRLAAILARSDWSMEELEEAIAFDPGLAPRILRMANSALASRGHPITSVREAVMRIGSGPILSIAMGRGVRRRMDAALPQFGLAKGAFWNHSVAAALAVELLACPFQRELPVEAFTAALLHDVGKLVMARFLDPDARARLRAAEREARAAVRAAEVDLFGADHGELGAEVTRHWLLPAPLAHGIRFHHFPAESKEPVAHAVHVGEEIARIVDARRAGRPLAADTGTIDAVARESLKLDDPTIAELAELVDARLNEVLQRYA
jgi:HD-like signal output (HDOD) protein